MFNFNPASWGESNPLGRKSSPFQDADAKVQEKINIVAFNLRKSYKSDEFVSFSDYACT